MSILTMSRGDNKTVTETIQPKDALGNQILGSGGITGWQFWLTAKRDPSDPDTAAVVRKVPADWSITTPGDANNPGVATCSIVPADTSGLSPWRVDLAFDVQAKDTGGHFFTIDSGTLTVRADQTISTT